MDDDSKVSVEYVSPGIRSSLVIGWSCPRLGFGELTCYFDENRKLHLDTEFMGAEFAKQVFAALVDGLDKKERIR